MGSGHRDDGTLRPNTAGHPNRQVGSGMRKKTVIPKDSSHPGRDDSWGDPWGPAPSSLFNPHENIVTWADRPDGGTGKFGGRPLPGRSKGLRRNRSDEIDYGDHRDDYRDYERLD